jgi:formamidopyrimidine-DNA glycosylase
LKYKAKLRARVEADSIEAQAATEIESEVPEITVKAKTAKAKTTKSKVKTTKEKTPCKYCEKLFVYPDKHEKNCKKNTEVVSSHTSESIAIKA